MGAMGARLAQLAPYVGVEPDPTSRAIAKQAIGDRGRVLESLEGVADNDFGFVCAFEVLEHVEDDAAVLTEWATHLRPGGSVLLSAPAFADRFGAWDEHVGHLRRYDLDQMRSLLQEVGFVNIEVRAVGFPVSFALEAARNLVAKRRSSAETADIKTAGSARLMQPKSGTLLRLAAMPMRKMQAPFPERGTGLVAFASLPA